MPDPRTQALMYFHGACDEEEAEDRLRTRGDGGLALTMTFIERKFYLVREGVTDRFVSLSVLYEGKYVHHTLMYGANHKWKEHGKHKSPPLAMKLEKSIKQLLGALPIPSEQLVAMRCPVEERAKRSGRADSFALPWWSGTKEKEKIRAGILLDSTGCFTLRASSKVNKFVLCVNDYGKMMEYLVNWVAKDNRWTFIDGKYGAVEEIIDVQ